MLNVDLRLVKLRPMWYPITSNAHLISSLRALPEGGYHSLRVMLGQERIGGGWNYTRRIAERQSLHFRQQRSLDIRVKRTEFRTRSRRYKYLILTTVSFQTHTNISEERINLPLSLSMHYYQWRQTKGNKGTLWAQLAQFGPISQFQGDVIATHFIGETVGIVLKINCNVPQWVRSTETRYGSETSTYSIVRVSRRGREGGSPSQIIISYLQLHVLCILVPSDKPANQRTAIFMKEECVP